VEVIVVAAIAAPESALRAVTTLTGDCRRAKAEVLKILRISKIRIFGIAENSLPTRFDAAKSRPPLFTLGREDKAQTWF
jgi:hypothetical protein